MIKKYIITVFLFSLFSFTYVFAEENVSEEGTALSCEYQGDIDICIVANAGGTERAIETFVCPSTSSKEEITYQVVLDKEFKKIDKKIDEYIWYLDENKDLYFGPNAKQNVLDGINEIEAKFGENGEYSKEYRYLCDAENKDGIVNKTVQCLGGKTAIDVTKDFFSSSLCEKVFTHKLKTYKMTAYRILQLNKSEVRKDNKKEFFQERRSKYDALYDAMMVNLGYLERIWRKWKSKIKYN